MDEKNKAIKAAKIGRVVPTTGPFPISSADQRAKREILGKLIERSQNALDFSDDVNPTNRETTVGDILCAKERHPSPHAARDKTEDWDMKSKIKMPKPTKDQEDYLKGVDSRTTAERAADVMMEQIEVESSERLGQGANGGGLRLNAGKNRIELLPPEWLWALADVMTQGSRKYPPRNWEKGMDWSSMIGCMYRHLAKFQAGQRFDGVCFDKNEGTTGCHELAMVAWNALALMVYDIRNIGNNDLPILDQLDLFNDVNAATSVLETRWEIDRISPLEPGDVS